MEWGEGGWPLAVFAACGRAWSRRKGVVHNVLVCVLLKLISVVVCLYNCKTSTFHVYNTIDYRPSLTHTHTHTHHIHRETIESKAILMYEHQWRFKSHDEPHPFVWWDPPLHAKPHPFMPSPTSSCQAPPLHAKPHPFMMSLTPSQSKQLQ